ncbi:MAG: pyridoxal-phosphate dependent enzyme [Candidatus Heimdallarchaeaceae archaeon]
MRSQKFPVCTNCGKEINTIELLCPSCKGILSIPPIAGPKKEDVSLRTLWDFRAFLPAIKNIVSLKEGNTPVIKLKNDKTLQGISAKCEFRNPTGNFRDRASTLIISDCVDKDIKEIVSSSTGSFSISLAAYAAQAQIKCTNVMPKHLELAKIEQIKVFGSDVIEAGDDLREAIEHAAKVAQKKKAYFITSENNILTVEGQKTIALELVKQMDNIETIIVPRGSGSLAYSLYRGFQDATESKWIEDLPEIIMVSLERTYTSKLAESLNMKEKSLFEPILKMILKEMGGKEISIPAEMMIDEAINLAQKEGIFIEPASASVLAAARTLSETKEIINSKTALILTSSGINALNVFAYKLRGKRKIVWGLSQSSTTKFEILNLIAETKANYGYAIWKLLGENQTLQSIYQHLSELEKMGLIEAITIKKRKQYKITKEGLVTLEKMRDLVDYL